MPVPPITIGPFDNVPAPGSPIRSDWCQEISHYVVDYLAPVVARVAQIQGDVAIVTTDTNGGAGFNAPTAPAGSIGLTLSTMNPALMDTCVTLYSIAGTLVSFVVRHGNGVPVADAGVTIHWQVV